MDEHVGLWETVGRFWAEERQGGRSVALSAWLLTSEDKEVAEAVARLYGGKSRNYGQQTDTFEVLLDSDNIAVHVDGPASVINRLVLKEGRELGHVCNGVRFLEPMADVGQPCGCSGNITPSNTATAFHAQLARIGGERLA